MYKTQTKYEAKKQINDLFNSRRPRGPLLLTFCVLLIPNPYLSLLIRHHLFIHQTPQIHKCYNMGCHTHQTSAH